jgi:hypothetical protein
MCVKPEVLLTTNRAIERNIQHWACGDIKGNENQMASECLLLFDLWHDAAIGIEQFDLRQLAVQLSPVSVRAKIDYGLWLQEKWEAEEEERDMGRGRYMYTQTPSMAKQTLDDDKMRRFKLWVPGADHKRDAIKHCYTFLQRCQEKPKLRANAWPALFKADGTLLSRRPPTSKRSKY